MTRSRPPRMYRGRPPRNGVLVAVFDGLPSAQLGSPPEVWRLYLRKQVSDKHWLSFKLCAEGTAAYKGNYWIGWSVRGWRFNRVSDSARLYKGRPALFVEVLQAIIALVSEVADTRQLPSSYVPVRATFANRARTQQ